MLILRGPRFLEWITGLFAIRVAHKRSETITPCNAHISMGNVLSNCHWARSYCDIIRVVFSWAGAVTPALQPGPSPGGDFRHSRRFCCAETSLTMGACILCSAIRWPSASAGCLSINQDNIRDVISIRVLQKACDAMLQRTRAALSTFFETPFLPHSLQRDSI